MNKVQMLPMKKNKNKKTSFLMLIIIKKLKNLQFLGLSWKGLTIN
jgi:hypothetical protein